MLNYQEAAKLKEEICSARKCVCSGTNLKDCVLLFCGEFSNCAFSNHHAYAERRLIAYRDSKRLKLSETGLMLLKALGEEYKDWWIAADESGEVFIFDAQPRKNKKPNVWASSKGGGLLKDFSLYSNHFPITWQDEPKQISEWIKESE